MNEPLRFLWFGKRSCFCCRRRCCVSEGFDMKRCWRIPSSKCRIWNNPHPNKVVRSLLAWVRIVAECSMRKKLRRHEVLLTIPTQPSSHVFRVSSPSNSKSALSPSDSPKTIGLNHICIHRPGGRQHWTNQPTSFLLGDHFYNQPTPYPRLKLLFRQARLDQMSGQAWIRPNGNAWARFFSNGLQEWFAIRDWEWKE